MAQEIRCDLCGEEAAVMLQSNVVTGEVVAVGGACLVPFYLGAVKGLAETLTAEVGQAYWPAVSDLTTLPAWGEHLPPPGKSAPKPRPKAASGPVKGPAAPSGGPGAEPGSEPPGAAQKDAG